uniref:Uncharacterized protein n=1 Tax=Panagrolaimus sp. ES5 TaxID=591445 RepID=A0AC34G0T5_9BILA
MIDSGLILTIMTAWAPVLNPLVTLIVVTQYRNFVLQWFKGITKKHSISVGTTGTTVANRLIFLLNYIYFPGTIFEPGGIDISPPPATDTTEGLKGFVGRPGKGENASTTIEPGGTGAKPPPGVETTLAPVRTWRRARYNDIITASLKIWLLI